jgi:hypothetical protein
MGEYSGSYETQHPNKSDAVMDVEAALCFALARANYTVRDIAKRLSLDPMTVCRRLDRLILLHSRPSRSVMRLLEGDRLDDLSRTLDQVLYGPPGADSDPEAFAERAVAAHLTPVDVASLVRTGLAASAARRALWGLDHTDESGADTPLEPAAEPEPWELAAREHRDEQEAKINRGEFD